MDIHPALWMKNRDLENDILIDKLEKLNDLLELFSEAFLNEYNRIYKYDKFKKLGTGCIGIFYEKFNSPKEKYIKNVMYEVFQKYEHTFYKVCILDNSDYYTSMLAINTVKRINNHLIKFINTNDKVSESLLLESFINGFSKIFEEQEDLECFCKLNNNVGIFDQFHKKYFVLKDGTADWGYRLLFDVEVKKLGFLAKRFTITNLNEEYDYVLLQKKSKFELPVEHKEVSNHILYNINTVYVTSLVQPSNIALNNTKNKLMYGIKHPVRGFICRDAELNQLFMLFNKSNIEIGNFSTVAITGIGGIGKTELARMFIYKYKEQFENIVWCDIDNFQNNYQQLADKLNIAFINRNVLEVVKDIYEHLNGNSMIIFDNAKNYKVVSSFLPSNLTPELYNISVLITSRNRNWGTTREGEIVKIHIGTVSKEEAMNFVKREISITENDNNIYTLCNRMENIPLALYQAVTYINKKSQTLPGSEYSILSYLADLKLNVEELLCFKIDERYLDTIYSTWLKAINNLKILTIPESKLAIDIFEIIAYLSPNHIKNNKYFFDPYLSNVNTNELSKAISLLYDYCLINVDNSFIKVLGLLQLVIRLELEKSNRNIDILKKYVNIIRSDDDGIDNDNKLFILTHACKYEKLISHFKHRRFDLVNETINLVVKYNLEQIELLELLLQNININYNMKDSNSILMFALENNREDLAKEILKLNPDINHYNKNGQTALMLAAQLNNIDILNILIGMGAKVNQVDKYRKSALIIAAENNNVDIIRALLHHGANVNQLDYYKKSALALATIHNHVEVINILQQHGAK